MSGISKILRLLSLLGFCCLFGLNVEALPIKPNTVVVQHHLAKTALSKKAAHLKVSMTKAQVLKLLGSATWGDSDKGVPLTLAWRNGNCNPVVVTFDKNMKVNGWDEGRVECKDSTYTDVPDVEYSCEDPHNLGICTLFMKKREK